MDPHTPPYSSPATPEPPDTTDARVQSLVRTPQSITSAPLPTFDIPKNLTQDVVEVDPQLKRLQKDLLILTSFNDNSTLLWRPHWFNPAASVPLDHLRYWTLHNPPHVITEELPRKDPLGRQVMTRRMRRPEDPPPLYLKTEADWERYCDLYGIPYDFLCEGQLRLMRLGLPQDGDGKIRAPSSWPLYPEPQPYGHYILDTNARGILPRRFHNIESPHGEEGECVVVDSTGAVTVEGLKDAILARRQGPGRRWSHLPWTEEQEVSCRPVTLKLRFWNSAMGIN